MCSCKLQNKKRAGRFCPFNAAATTRSARLGGGLNGALLLVKNYATLCTERIHHFGKIVLLRAGHIARLLLKHNETSPARVAHYALSVHRRHEYKLPLFLSQRFTVKRRLLRYSPNCAVHPTGQFVRCLGRCDGNICWQLMRVKDIVSMLSVLFRMNY